MNISFLIGERLYLRGLLKDDLSGKYVQWFNDPEVCFFNSHHVFPYSYDQAESYIKQNAGSKSSLVLAIVAKDTNAHIGNLSLQNIDYIHRNAEFAIVLGEKDYWGKGYAKEASKLIMHHGFTEMNLHRIYCGTSSKNVAMQKLAEYLGMTKEGCKKEALFKHGSYVDVFEYGVLKKDFFSSFSC